MTIREVRHNAGFSAFSFHFQYKPIPCKNVKLLLLEISIFSLSIQMALLPTFSSCLYLPSMGILNGNALIGPDPRVRIQIGG